MRVYASSQNPQLLQMVAPVLVSTGAVQPLAPTQHVTLFVMPEIQPAAMPVAAAMLARCENDLATLAGFFGANAIPKFQVTLTGLSQYLDGTGGALHPSCTSASIFCDIKLNPLPAPDVSSCLFIAEAVEVFEALQNIGWSCGYSNGEGLSRVLASAIVPTARLADPTDPVGQGYCTAGAWLNSWRPNWVDATNTTDTDPESNGCAVLFLNWLRTQFSWSQICAAGTDTLANTYQKLTGRNEGWQQFSAVISQKFPPGADYSTVPDNPF